jgi:hypothetical protein
MPYERKGKCVYNKETGKKKGCSSSVAKAKAYLKALYASEPEVVNEELSQDIKDRAQDIYSAMKASKKAVKNAVSKYGNEAQNVLYGRAVNVAKKQVKPMNEKRLKEIITKLIHEKLKGGQKKLDANKDGKISGEDFKLLRSKSVKEGGEGRTENYMFFSNLKQMHRQIEILMQMDPNMIDMILQNGHDWADDHVTEAKTNMDQVFDFIMNETK